MLGFFIFLMINLFILVTSFGLFAIGLKFPSYCLLFGLIAIDVSAMFNPDTPFSIW